MQWSGFARGQVINGEPDAIRWWQGITGSLMERAGVQAGDDEGTSDL